MSYLPPAGESTRSSGLSIGAVSRATGIPVETLRTWEQRYGFPIPQRRPSGHRVYSPSVIPRLRRINEALARGCRPGDAVGATDTQLGDLLAVAAPGGRTALGPEISGESLEGLLEAVATFDSDRLRQRLLQDWAGLGPLTFLERRVAPLIRVVGERWSRGELQIGHEHFLSERLGDLLRLLRGTFEERATGPLVVLATLPGELHTLGLQMAALTVATAGLRILYLGPETPVEQIVDVAGNTRARAVALSVSIAAPSEAVKLAVADLRARLPQEVGVIVGGAGAQAAPADVDRVSTLADLNDLVQRLRSA